MNEDGKQASVEIRLATSAPIDVTVDYHTADRSAVAGQDYQPSSGSLVFANGETNKTFVIPILDDSLAEGDEVFGIVLVNLAGATLVGRNELLVAIRDDEHPVVRDATFSSPALDGEIEDMTFQPDGKLLIGGTFFSVDGFASRSVARLNPDGSVDRTFSPHITAGINGPVHALQLLPDGSVLIAGGFSAVQGYSTADWGKFSSVARLRPDGVVDRGFRFQGFPETTQALALLPDGKIMMAGGSATYGPQMGRFFLDGSPDVSFGVPKAAVDSLGHLRTIFGIPGDSVGQGFFTIGVQADGKILAGGAFSQIGGRPRSSLARLKPNGLLDVAFDVALTPRRGLLAAEVRRLIVQPDDKIVIAGPFEKVNGLNRPGLARLNADGSLDTSFEPGKSGRADFSNVRSLLRAADGGILWTGFGSPLAPDRRSGIVRLDPSGNLDAHFNPAFDGISPISHANTAVIQHDGQILVAGAGVDRLVASSAGLRGLGFSAATTNRVAEGSFLTVIVERLGDLDGPVLAATLGTQNGAALGGRDFLAVSTNVAIPRGSRSVMVSIPVIRDGIAEMDEHFELTLSNPGPGLQIGGLARFKVVINDNDLPSVVDMGFQSEEWLSGPIALQSDGKILVGQWNTLWRLNPDGTTDENFQQSYRSTNWISRVVQYADGRMLVAGQTANSSYGVVLFRMHADGSLDTSFTAPSFPGAQLRGLWIRPDGKAIVATSFGVSLLNDDGSPDNPFGLEQQVNPTAFAVQADGKFVLHHNGGMVFNYLTVQRHFPNGSLDPTFQAPWFSLRDGGGDVTAIAAGPDGSVFFTGPFRSIYGVRLPGLAKLHPDGLLDLDFHPIPTVFSGQAYPFGSHNSPISLSVQADGRILLLTYRFGLVPQYWTGSLLAADSLIRLNQDGSLDSDFQFDRFFQGRVSIGAMAVQSNGDILLSAGSRQIWGDPNPRLIRIFGSSHAVSRIGFATNRFFSGESDARPVITVRREGDVGGSASVELRLNGGTATEKDDFQPFATALHFAPLETEKSVLLPMLADPFAEPDETLAVTLTSPKNTGLNCGEATLVIVDDDRPGSLDASFVPELSPPGPNEGLTVAGLEVLVDGTVVAETVRYGPQAKRAIEFLRPDGSWIARFPDQNTGFVVWALGAVRGRDVFVWALRDNKPHLVQLRSNGTIVKELPVELLSAYVPPSELVMLSDGSFLVSGSGVGTVRLLPDGSRDTNFKVTTTPYAPTVMVLDQSERLLVGGGFTEVNGSTNAGIARIHLDGRLDDTFVSRPGVEVNRGSPALSMVAHVYALAVQRDGKILFGGWFDSYNAVARKNLARINPDGSLDSAYDPASALAEIGPFPLIVQRIALQTDGKSLVQFEGSAGGRIVRLNPDGTVDRTFAFTGRIEGGGISALALQPNDDLLIGGAFTVVNGTARPGLARLKADAALRIHSRTIENRDGIPIAVAVSIGREYALEKSNDLRAWSPIMTNLATSARLEFQDPAGPGTVPRFYRVRRVR